MVGIRRKGHPLDHPLANIRLRFGDTLLVRGRSERLAALRSQYRQFVLIGEADLHGAAEPERRAPLAMLVVLAMAVLLVSRVMSAPRNGQPLGHSATRVQRGDQAEVDFEARPG